MRSKAFSVSPPGENTPAKVGLLYQISPNFFARREEVIGGTNACIHVSILPYVVECQCTE